MPLKFLPGICRGGGPCEAWWRGSFRLRRTPPPRFARSPSPGNPGEEFRFLTLAARAVGFSVPRHAEPTPGAPRVLVFRRGRTFLPCRGSARPPRTANEGTRRRGQCRGRHGVGRRSARGGGG